MIQLFANQYCFKIDTTDNDWCKCWLITGENETYLGAERLKYLKDHLLAGLDDSPKENSGRLLEDNFSWVLSLSEVHTTLYAEMDGQDRVLFFQDANAKEVCRIRLSQDRCSQWLDKIKSI